MNREWTIDEILYIIYKNGGVAQLGQEAKFVDYYFSKEKLTEQGLTREEIIEAFEIVNQHMLEEIESYYAMGLSIKDIMESEADKYHTTTVEALFVPLFDRAQLH